MNQAPFSLVWSIDSKESFTQDIENLEEIGVISGGRSPFLLPKFKNLARI